MKKILFGAVASAILLSAAPAGALNLVLNGDFTAGNTGFTSEYDYKNPNPGDNTAAGEYTVTTDPYPWNPFFYSAGDHTDGLGNMFVGNGSATLNEIVWESGLINIATSMDYFFEAFVMNVCCNDGYSGTNSAPNLTFTVSLDGGLEQILDTLTIPLSPPGVWYGLSTNFNSGPASNAVLRLRNANTTQAGNDFAVDDISLDTVSVVRPVPEPATWGMMLLGFGALGATMRRQRAKIASAA